MHYFKFKSSPLWIFLLTLILTVRGQSSHEVDNDSSFYRVGQGQPISGGHPMAIGGDNGLHNMTDIKPSDRVSDIVHGLLSKYDNRVRPFYPDAAVFVTVKFGGIQVVDVVEGKNEVGLIVLILQTWEDPRLAFGLESTGVEYINVNHDHVREFWLPDTFVENEKRAEGQENSVSNDAVTVFKNGTVLRSTRMSLSTHCEFAYGEFPFDEQECGITVGSHAYRDKDVTYGWDEQFVVDVDGQKGVFIKSPHAGRFFVTGTGVNESVIGFDHGKMSRLTFTFTLQRAWKPFVTRFYVPMVLFVFVSLGTLFFADLRTALLVNLFNLAFVNLFVAIRSSSSDIPTTSTYTAYDTYTVLCVCYIATAITVVVIRLLNSKRSTTNRYSVQEPSTSSSADNRRSEFPTLVLRQNRRRDSDIFNPNEDNGDSFGADEGQSEMRQIYRSTSYPVVRGVGWWGVAVRKVGKFGGWVWKYLRWILIVSFLFSDFVYFKIHAVKYG